MTRSAGSGRAERDAAVVTATTIDGALAMLSAKFGVAASARPDLLERWRGVAHTARHVMARRSPCWPRGLQARPIRYRTSLRTCCDRMNRSARRSRRRRRSRLSPAAVRCSREHGLGRELRRTTDSFANTWTQIGGEHTYAGTDFYTALWDVAAAQGGAGHTLSVAKAGRPAGEISLAFIEVANGGDVRAIYKLAAAGHETPGSIAVDRPATLIAIWGGDSFELTHTAVPDNGFNVFDYYLVLGPSRGVQVAIAAKQVSTPGNYTVNWTSTPQQNAACYLIAVEWQAADTIFVDGFNR